MKNIFGRIAHRLRRKEEAAAPKRPEPFPQNAQSNRQIKEELEKAIEKSREIKRRKCEDRENGTAEKQPAFDAEFTLEFHFKGRRETDLDEINNALGQHRLSDISLEKYSGFLATQTTMKTETSEESVRRWYGLDDCVLRCTPAAPDAGDAYQISTAVMDKSIENCAAWWQESNPERTLRTLVQIEYEACYAVLAVHRARKASDAPIKPAAAPERSDGSFDDTCGEGMTWRQEGDVLYIEGEGEIEGYAFYGDSTIRKIVIAPGCTGIGDSAFGSCEALEETELPDGLLRIGRDAFCSCEELTLRVPDSVTEIGEHAFWEIKNLIYNGPAQDKKEIEWGARNSFKTEEEFRLANNWEIKENTLYIYAEGATPQEEMLVKGWHPMANEYEMMSPWRDAWERIKHVVIAPGCTRISADAFYGFSRLETITIPDTVESIGKTAFSGCKNLRSIDLHDGVKAIEKRAFQQCESLTFVKIPGGVTEIAEHTFDGCICLEHVRIPESITSIESYAFAKCSALKQVVLPNSITRIGSSAFEGCSALEAVRIPGGVKVISGRMFTGCAALTRVLLEQGIEKIEWSAFFRCSQMKEIVIPASVTEIAGSALGGIGLDAVWRLHPDNPCYKIENGLLIDKVNKILIRCLNEIKGKYDIPDGIEEIGEYAFFGQSGLEAVSFPNDVKVIGSNAFSRTGLFYADIPESVERIESFAFSDCANLNSAQIPGSVKELVRFTFSNCMMLTSVEIGEGVVKLDGSVFNGCPNLRSIDLPASVKHIESYTFSEMENLSAIRIANAEGTNEVSFVSRDGVLFSADMRHLVRCPQAKEGTYQIPDGVEVIESHAFSGCKRLTDVQIPESVKAIGRYAFLDCSALASLRIPDSVSIIELDAFKGVVHIVCHSPALNDTWVWGALSRN